MDGAAIRRTRTTLLNKISLPEQQSGAGSSGGKTTLLDFIQEDTAGASWSPQTEEVRPMRVSLMTLLSLGEAAHAKESAPAGSFSAGKASAGAERKEEEVEKEATPAEERMLCCVCMVRRKGAAFIPCGHTFCRACSRELVAGRGNCPVCNAAIFDVLDIF